MNRQPETLVSWEDVDAALNEPRHDRPGDDGGYGLLLIILGSAAISLFACVGIYVTIQWLYGLA